MGCGSIGDISITSPQFCYEPKITLKKKRCYFKKKLAWIVNTTFKTFNQTSLLPGKYFMGHIHSSALIEGKVFEKMGS